MMLATEKIATGKPNVAHVCDRKEYEADFKAQLAQTFIEYLKPSVRESCPTVLESSPNWDTKNDVGILMDVGHVLDSLVSQKAELMTWLNCACHAPAGSAPRVQPVRLQSSVKLDAWGGPVNDVCRVASWETLCTASTTSPTESFYPSSESDDDIQLPPGQFFHHRPNGLIAPPPGLEHVIPQAPSVTLRFSEGLEHEILAPEVPGAMPHDFEGYARTARSKPSARKRRRQKRANAQEGQKQRSTEASVQNSVFTLNVELGSL